MIANACSIRPTKRWPSGVRRTPRAWRSNNRRPSQFSTAATRRLIAPCVTPETSAAARNEPRARPCTPSRDSRAAAANPAPALRRATPPARALRGLKRRPPARAESWSYLRADLCASLASCHAASWPHEHALHPVVARTARQPLIAAGAVAFTIVSWASAFPFIRIGLHGLTPLQLAAARFATAAVLIVAWLAVRRPRVPTRGDALRFLLCGFLGIALYNALLNTGEQTVSAGAASFIVNTLPIFTALLAAVFLASASIAGLARLAGQPRRHRGDRTRAAGRPRPRGRQHADSRRGPVFGQLLRAAAAADSGVRRAGLHRVHAAGRRTAAHAVAAGRTRGAGQRVARHRAGRADARHLPRRAGLRDPGPLHSATSVRRAPPTSST